METHITQTKPEKDVDGSSTEVSKDLYELIEGFYYLYRGKEKDGYERGWTWALAHLLNVIDGKNSIEDGWNYIKQIKKEVAENED